MDYRVAFKNGMVVRIEAESVHAAPNSVIIFRKGNDEDQDVYVSTSDVLFIAPKTRSSVDHVAVGPSEK
jgi:hypothetical protein